MYKVNNSRPRIEPLGTPCLTSSGSSNVGTLFARFLPLVCLCVLCMFVCMYY